MLKNMTASGDNIQKLKDEGIIEVMENGDVKFIYYFDVVISNNKNKGG